MVDGLGPLDRANVAFFAGSAEVAARSTGDRVRLNAAIDSAKVSSQATRYGPGLRLAQTIFEESELPSFELVLISDFQKSGWTGEEDVHLPLGTSVKPVALSDGDSIENVSVAGATLARQRFSGVERMAPLVRVIRVGGEAPLEATAVLEVDGRELQSKQVTLPASGAAQVTFDPFVLSARHMRGTIKVGSDGMPQDNAYHFVVSPGAATGVLLVGDGASSIGNAKRSALFLQSALATTEEGGFDVTLRGNAPTEADLTSKAVVILHDTPFPGGAAGTRLREFVEAGGGLVVAVGERGSWPSDQGDLFPGTLGPVSDREQRGSRLGEMDYSHPVFEIFAGPRSGDFTASRFFRARGLDVRSDDTTRVLARFDDGSVALAENRVGLGRVLVWTSTLDNYWNDLALQPVYLPFVHQLVRYASGRGDAVTSFLAGHVIDVGDGRAMASAGLGDVAGLLQEGERVVVDPAGEGLALRSAEGPLYLSLNDQGFYEIRPQGRADGERPLSVAVNVDLAESDLASIDPQEVVAAITAVPSTTPSGRGNRAGELRREDQEKRQGIWRALLLSAFLLLIVETAVSNRLSRSAAKRGSHA